jgi:hypothetical protein
MNLTPKISHTNMVGITVMIAYYRWKSKPGTGNRLEDFYDSRFRHEALYECPRT